MTPKQIRQLLAEFTSSPGYICNLTRAEFTALFDELESDVDIMDEEFATLGDSVAKRFTAFLQTGDQSDIDLIITKLRLIQNPPQLDDDEDEF